MRRPAEQKLEASTTPARPEIPGAAHQRRRRILMYR
jgi:hypothetical protein